MKAYAMLKIGESGWIEKERPKCGPMDAICRPLALAICTSDVHTLWEGAIGERHNMILGHEGCAEVVEVGELVKDFKPGDKVLVPAITPDWNSLEAQAGYSMHSGGMLAGWKFSNFKDGVFGEYFHVKQMLSTDYETKIMVNRKQLLEDIDRARIMARDNDKQPLILKIADDSLSLKIISDLGRMDAEIPVKQEAVSYTHLTLPTIYSV